MDTAEPSRPGQTSRAVGRLAEWTWTELRDALDARPVIGVLPVGALEAHGPHLPLDTDRILAEAMAEAGAAELVRRGLEAVVLPAFVWTAAPFAREFPGTVDASAEAVGRLLGDVLESCRRWGLAAVVLANAHQDPSHVDVLRRLVDGRTRSGGWPVVFPDLTRRRWAERLGPDFREGDHAGRWESSIVRAVDEDAFRADVARTLRPHPASLVEAIRGGASSFAEVGATEAWVGDPAAADAGYGLQQIRQLGLLLADATSEALPEALRSSGEPG